MESGQWVRRGEDPWHLIATVEADDVVTRCKRRLPKVVKGVLLDRLAAAPNTDVHHVCANWRDSRDSGKGTLTAGQSGEEERPSKADSEGASKDEKKD